MKIFSKLLDSNEKQLQRLSKEVDKIKEIDISKINPEALTEKTNNFKSDLKIKLKDILTKDEFQPADIELIKKELFKILPESYALVKRASELTIEKPHYDVQLMAGVSLFEGKLVELATGEGKTLVATLPLYLYSLVGVGAHIITANDYLARRDAEWCGHIYNILGLSTGIVTSNASYKFVANPDNLSPVPNLNQMSGVNLIECSKKEAYACDITYCTNNELGFDYLRDNLCVSLNDMVLRKLFFCIVDEADSILIDEARTPLIISIPAEQSNDLYITFAKIVNNLKKDEDYTVDEKQRKVIINDNGIDKVESLLNVKNLWEDFLLAHHLENALSAMELYRNGEEYIIKDGNILIVDEFTGRLMEGRRFSEGMHQAIEAKEGVEIKEESKTMATITFQNLFRLYPVLSGMTGTALTEAEEFAKIYKLDVVVIPTNRKMVRQDRNDVIYKSVNAKFKAVIDEIKEHYKKGQPVLVGTISVERSEILSSLLEKEHLPHQVLNAKYHEKEAQIISHAGEKGQITISTNMAGRGTDITLGEGVKEAGGLAVIGTERHESRRIDNQLRGRSGRQGDPGETRFYISLEDDLMRIFGGARIAAVMNSLKFDESIPLDFKIFSKQIESAQKKIESMNFDSRKHVVEYDDVLNVQREIIYKRRRFIMRLFSFNENSETFSEINQELIEEERKKYILDKVNRQIENIVDIYASNGEIDDIDSEKILEEVHLIIPKDMFDKVLGKAGADKDEWIKLIKSGKKNLASDKFKEQLSYITEETYNLSVEQIPKEVFSERNKRELLRIIDILWIDHLDAITALKEGIGLSVYSQKDPLVEYKNEAYLLFEKLIYSIEYETSVNIFKLESSQIIYINESPGSVTNIEENLTGSQIIKSEKLPVAKRKLPKNTSGSAKVGRNDLCPCGSGKKFKKCGELNTPEHQARMIKINA